MVPQFMRASSAAFYNPQTFIFLQYMAHEMHNSLFLCSGWPLKHFLRRVDSFLISRIVNLSGGRSIRGLVGLSFHRTFPFLHNHIQGAISKVILVIPESPLLHHRSQLVIFFKSQCDQSCTGVVMYQSVCLSHGNRSRITAHADEIVNVITLQQPY